MGQLSPGCRWYRICNARLCPKTWRIDFVDAAGSGWVAACWRALLVVLVLVVVLVLEGVFGTQRADRPTALESRFSACLHDLANSGLLGERAAERHSRRLPETAKRFAILPIGPQQSPNQRDR